MTEQAHTEPKPDEAKPTLEDLYDEIQVETTKPAPLAAEQKPAENEPAIRDELASLRNELAADRERRIRSAEEVDLKNAIATLGKEAGINGKDKLARGFLMTKAQEDPRLKKIWDNREQNPTAWNKALKILGPEFKDELSLSDDQLAENQKALDESQRGTSTTAPAPAGPQAKAMSMNDGEFSQFWARLSGRG